MDVPAQESTVIEGEDSGGVEDTLATEDEVTASVVNSQMYKNNLAKQKALKNVLKDTTLAPELRKKAQVEQAQLQKELLEARDDFDTKIPTLTNPVRRGKEGFVEDDGAAANLELVKQMHSLSEADLNQSVVSAKKKLKRYENDALKIIANPEDQKVAKLDDAQNHAKQRVSIFLQ